MVYSKPFTRFEIVKIAHFCMGCGNYANIIIVAKHSNLIHKHDFAAHLHQLYINNIAYLCKNEFDLSLQTNPKMHFPFTIPNGQIHLIRDRCFGRIFMEKAVYCQIATKICVMSNFEMSIDAANKRSWRWNKREKFKQNYEDCQRHLAQFKMHVVWLPDASFERN